MTLAEQAARQGPDVFLSHSAEDKRIADAACHFLESAGFRCWIAPRDVPAGSNWGASIVRAIETSRVMVLIFSASSNASPQVLREVERAVNKGVPILPVRVADVVPSKDLEYDISTQHWLDELTPPIEERLKEVVRAVQALLAPGEKVVRPAGDVLPDRSARQVAPPAPRRVREPRRRVVKAVGVLGLMAATALGICWWQFPWYFSDGIDSVRARAKAAAEGSREELELRRALADRLAADGLLNEAADEFLWVWEHSKAFPSYSGVRVSFLSGDMKELAARHPPARARFVHLRDETGARIFASKDARRDLDDWIELNDVVGEPEKTLEWFDQVKDDEAWHPLLRASHDVERRLEAARRWEDIDRLHPEKGAQLDLAVASLLGRLRALDRRCLLIEGNLGSEALKEAFTLPAAPIGDLTVRAHHSGIARDRAAWTRQLVLDSVLAPIESRQAEALAMSGADAIALSRFADALQEVDRQCEALAVHFEGLAVELEQGSVPEAQDVAAGGWRIDAWVVAIQYHALAAHLDALEVLTELCDDVRDLEPAVLEELEKLRVLEPRTLLTRELRKSATARLAQLDRNLRAALQALTPIAEDAAAAERERLEQILREADNLELLPGDDHERYVLKAILARGIGDVERSADIYRRYGEDFRDRDPVAEQYASVGQVYTRDPGARAHRQALYVYEVRESSPASRVLQVGDVIEAAGGKPMCATGDLMNFRKDHAGTQAELEIFRITAEHPEGERLKVQFVVPADQLGIGVQHI
jgi:hypothetical protein